MIIELHGGPLDGVIHELPVGLPAGILPDRLALRSHDDDPQLHWYETGIGEHAHFVESETTND